MTREVTGQGPQLVISVGAYSSNTLIGFKCLPVEMSDLISHTELVNDHCLNVSRHRPVVLIPDSHIDTCDTINVDTSNPIN